MIIYKVFGDYIDEDEKYFSYLEKAEMYSKKRCNDFLLDIKERRCYFEDDEINSIRQEIEETNMICDLIEIKKIQVN